MNKRSFHRLQDKAFQYWGVFSTLVGLILLAVFIGSILIDGVGRLDWQFLTSLPSRKAENAGVLTAWTGSLWLFVMTAVISIPIGVAAGIHLEEYVKKNRWSSFLEINIHVHLAIWSGCNWNAWEPVNQVFRRCRLTMRWTSRLDVSVTALAAATAAPDTGAGQLKR
jgi:hypothetical protein